MKQCEICDPKTKKQEYIGGWAFFTLADRRPVFKDTDFSSPYRKRSLIVGLDVRNISGHITMYGQKQPAGRSKSRRGPDPARGPYVACLWPNLTNSAGEVS